MIEMVISGGQSGADRGGLLAAKALGIPTGGWCPRRRRAEDGPIPPEFDTLRETLSTDYPDRTERNVKDSDSTVLFTWGRELSPGSEFTKNMAARHQKPICIIDAKEADDVGAVEIIRVFIEKAQPKILNVAGTRESKAPGIQAKVERIMRLVLQR